ncbi:MAG: DarT ssDNA thymidine ADP-ribosyltransferase family protein [Flavobacteriaceae bacterium]|nr:DarT ssDNA thymidine ADP-ribosyltransferase family protein [Flavobacteriaceae bacterium]
MNLKEGYREFQKEMKYRDIEYLIHFTSVKNLSKILKCNELLCRAKMKPQEYEKYSDDYYWSKPNYVHLSLSAPNTRMLFIKQKDYLQEIWCVLKIDPKYIYESETLFSIINSSSTAANKHFGISGCLSKFKELFQKGPVKYSTYKNSEKTLLRPPSIHDKYPTCVQAEILVKDIVPLESIIEVCFKSEEEMSEAKAIMYSLDTSRFVVDEEIFSPGRSRGQIKHKKYKGSLKLAAIGDALGWMTEFEKSQDSVKKKFRTEKITSFYDWKKRVGGRFYGYTDNIKQGSYSDDTQLLLSVARSIKIDGLVDQEYFAKKELPDWLLYHRGAGRTIKNAAQELSKKNPPKWNENFFDFKIGKTTIDYRDCGANGAAMRILPIALANYGNWDKIKKEIFGNSIITHGHPRAILGAMLYGCAINSIIRLVPYNFNYKNFLNELCKDFHQTFSIDFIDDNIELKSWEREWDKSSQTLFGISFFNSKDSFRKVFELILDETLNYLRTVSESISDSVSDFEVLTKLGCYEYETKGSGTSTVIAGIYFACKYSKEPIKGIEEAVNSLGTDTDSIAAFTGGLLGALHGESIIPQRWQQYPVQDCYYIGEVSIGLLQISENRAEEIKKQTRKERVKLISKIEDDKFKIKDKVFLETLGEGIVQSKEIQYPLTKDKLNLIYDVEFIVGQSCRFLKRLSK